MRGLAASPAGTVPGGSTVTLTLSATDNVGVTGLRLTGPDGQVLRDQSAGSAATVTFTVPAASAREQLLAFKVTARDAAGNTRVQEVTVRVAAQAAADIQAPTAGARTWRPGTRTRRR